MRNLKILLTVIVTLVIIQACNSSSFKSEKADDKADSASYMIGISVGYSLKMQDVPDVNAKLIAKGIMEVLNSDSAVSMQEANMFLSAYFAELREIKARENLEKGRLFLERLTFLTRDGFLYF